MSMSILIRLLMPKWYDLPIHGIKMTFLTINAKFRVLRAEGMFI